jgi:hypothetical protein
LLAYLAAVFVAALILWTFEAPSLVKAVKSSSWIYFEVLGFLFLIVLFTPWLPASMAVLGAVFLKQEKGIFFLISGALGGLFLPLIIEILVYRPYWTFIGYDGAVLQLIRFIKEVGLSSLLAGAVGGYIFWKVSYVPSNKA